MQFCFWLCSGASRVIATQATCRPPTSRRPPCPPSRSPKSGSRLSRDIVLTGEFRPYQSIELHAKVAGYLKAIEVDVGDRVRAGQLIAALEIPEIAHDLAHAAAQIRLATSELVSLRGELQHAETNRELVDLPIPVARRQEHRSRLRRAAGAGDVAPRKRVHRQVAAAPAAIASAEQQVETSARPSSASKQWRTTLTSSRSVLGPDHQAFRGHWRHDPGRHRFANAGPCRRPTRPDRSPAARHSRSRILGPPHPVRRPRSNSGAVAGQNPSRTGRPLHKNGHAQLPAP